MNSIRSCGIRKILLQLLAIAEQQVYSVSMEAEFFNDCRPVLQTRSNEFIYDLLRQESIDATLGEIRQELPCHEAVYRENKLTAIKIRRVPAMVDDPPSSVHNSHACFHSSATISSSRSILFLLHR